MVICSICNKSGHWIQQCPSGKKRRKKKKNTSAHIYQPGIDPSQGDIEKARELQKIKPPLCYCKISSRLRKVKYSIAGGETSTAIGKYFFFCSKAKTDKSKCNFARPVEEETKKQEKKIRKKERRKELREKEASSPKTEDKDEKKEDDEKKGDESEKKEDDEKEGDESKNDPANNSVSDSGSDDSSTSSSSSSSSSSSGSSSDSSDDNDWLE